MNEEFDYEYTKYDKGDRVIARRNAYHVLPGTAATVQGEITGNNPRILVHLTVDGDPYPGYVFYENEFERVE